MRKGIILTMLAGLWTAATAQTLEECQAAARANYPLIKRYELLERTTQLTVENLQKGWLPQLQAQAQATLQSDVVTLPDALKGVMSQMGTPVPGLKKEQYRVGIDVSQPIYDGGHISSQKELARRQGAVDESRHEVELYKVRTRVNEMYFGLLLIDDRIRLTADLQTLLAGSEQKLAAMFRNGTAAESDWNTVKAERLRVRQQLTELQARRQSLSRLLSLFCGLDVTTVVKPTPTEPADGTVSRPELSLIDAQLRLTDARERALNSALRPRLTAFATGFYGYPGYDMYHDMFHHSMTLNGMVGARLQWNLGALYTRKGDKAKLGVERLQLDVQRETFLFNNRLEQTQQRDDADRYRQLMADDDELISLRQSIRVAAESKLAHGIIDANDLVKEINNETAARLQRSTHEIEMLKSLYELKETVNAK